MNNLPRSALTIAAALAIFIGGLVSAAGSEKFDDCVRKLCVSTDQGDCWIKSGAALCDKDQISCTALPEHTFARVIEKAGRRWNVETIYGDGWVSDRMTMVDGSLCPE